MKVEKRREIVLERMMAHKAYTGDFGLGYGKASELAAELSEEYDADVKPHNIHDDVAKLREEAREIAEVFKDSLAPEKGFKEEDHSLEIAGEGEKR